MKLIQYNPETNIVIVETHGRCVPRELDAFISTGQVEELSEPDRAQLLVWLKDHPRIVADAGLGGGQSFSLPDQQPMLLLLCGLYLALMVFRPVILPGHLHVSGIEVSLASVLLALAFPLLEVVRDLYGKRKAWQLRLFTVVILLGMAGLYALQLNYLPTLVSGNHEGSGHSHSLAGMGEFYHAFPETYVLLALALWLADSLNTQVFGKIATLKKAGKIFQHFAVRSVLSSILAQLVFMPLAAFLLKTFFWHGHDAHFFLFILDISLCKLLLVMVCQSLALAIVYGTRSWRRVYVKGNKFGSRWSVTGVKKELTFGGYAEWVLILLII